MRKRTLLLPLAMLLLVTILLALGTGPGRGAPAHPDGRPHKVYFPIVHTDGEPCPDPALVSEKIGFAPTLLPPERLYTPLCARPDALYMTWHPYLHPNWKVGEQVPMIWGWMASSYSVPGKVKNLLAEAKRVLPATFSRHLIFLNEPDIDHDIFDYGGQAAMSPLNAARHAAWVMQEWPHAKLVGPCVSEMSENGEWTAEFYYYLRRLQANSGRIVANCLHLYTGSPPSIPGFRDGINGDEQWPDIRVQRYLNGLEANLIRRGFNPTEARAIRERELWITETGVAWNLADRTGYPYTYDQVYRIAREWLRRLEEDPNVTYYFAFGGEMRINNDGYGWPGHGMIAGNTFTAWGQAITDHIRWTAGVQPAAAPPGPPPPDTPHPSNGYP